MSTVFGNKPFLHICECCGKQEILTALNADGIKIEKNQIKDFPSIKGVGQYKITLQFIKEVSVDIVANVNVK